MAAEEHDPQEQSVTRHEQPADWGWHTEMGKVARYAGWLSALVLVLLVFSTHGSKWELVWSVGFAAVLVFSLLRDRTRRKNAWRS